MIKVTQRYNIAFLNHNGDHLNLLTTVVFALVYFYVTYVHSYSMNGPPLAAYEPIVPKGNSLFAYYGLPNSKLKKEPQILEISKDMQMSHFSFSDVGKIFPYSDNACWPDGVCLDTNQVYVKLSIIQETDVSKKPKNFFQLTSTGNSTADGLSQLIVKNETATGEIFLEGTIKQIKNLLKNHMVVRPACMFDSKIQVNFKINY